jgi:hypothetical protein
MYTALESAVNGIAKAKYAELEEAFLAFHDIYYHWVATEQEFIYENHGRGPCQSRSDWSRTR